MAGLVLVEGLPGSGKTTTCGLLERWGRARGVPVRYVGEGRTDHPADLEQVALLSDADLRRLRARFGRAGEEVARAAEPRAGYLLVRDRERAEWPEPLRAQLRARDAYDGDVAPELHRRALLDSWRQFTAAAGGDRSTYVFECVLIQNPVTALFARFDQPEDVVRGHVHELAGTVAGLDPLLVYLDAGDPGPVLRAAAAERPAAWLDFVVRYHTEQGHGLRRGLRGVDGLVELLRLRRELELRLLDTLPLRTCVLDVAGSSRALQHERLAAALGWDRPDTDVP